MKNNLHTVSSRIGRNRQDPTGAIVNPVFFSTTFSTTDRKDEQIFEYSRVQNPSRLLLEEKLASLEQGKFALACSSGQAASSMILSLLKSGDHLLLHRDAYDGTFRLLKKVFAKFGLEFRLADLTKPETVETNINRKTKMIWFETPTNPMLDIIDIGKISALAKRQKALCVVDNTVLGPCSQNPLSFGADLVIHSLTKSLNGHSDVTGGAVILKNKALFHKLKFNHHTLGIGLTPFDCFLTLRGLKTLPLRIRQAEANANKIALFLTTVKKVSQVIFPGFENHSDLPVIKKQMRGPGGIVTFKLKTGCNHPSDFLNRLKLVLVASSFGGPESLIQHPLSMISQTPSRKIQKNRGLDFRTFRLSAGLENADDIIADLKQALNSL